MREIAFGHGPAASAGDTVTIEYAGYDYKTGREFDRGHVWGQGEPATFTLGADEVIPGWNEGVNGMEPGSRRTLTIPPQLAYSSGSPPPEVGPKGPGGAVIFVVELLKLERAR